MIGVGAGFMGHFIDEGFSKKGMLRVVHAAPWAKGHMIGTINRSDQLMRNFVRQQGSFYGLVLVDVIILPGMNLTITC